MVKTPPLLAIDSAEAIKPWLKKVLRRIPAIKYGANCCPEGNLDANTKLKTIHKMKLVRIGLSRVHPIPRTLLLYRRVNSLPTSKRINSICFTGLIITSFSYATAK